MPFQETFSLSGFGGGYEAQCQKMLWRGIKFLEECKPPIEMWANAKSSPQIYGVVITEGRDLKALEAAMMHPGDDCTGAMHHCVMQHLHFIHNNGLDKWRSELRPHRQGDSPLSFDPDTETLIEGTLPEDARQ